MTQTLSTEKINKKIKVLLVCMGNICRSPTAEAVLTKKIQNLELVDWFEIDSAGTHRYHVGKAPDPRTIEAGESHGLDLAHLRARQLQPEDYYYYDYILLADTTNQEDSEVINPGNGTARVFKMLYFAQNITEEDVPDPYYGGPDGFKHVIELIEDGMDGFLLFLEQEGRLPETRSVSC